MAIKPEDRFMVLGLATQIYCARIMAGHEPDGVSCAAEAASLMVHVDRHMAPADRRKRPRPEEIALNERHRT